MDKDISLHFIYYGSWKASDEEVVITSHVGRYIADTAWYHISRCLEDEVGNPVTETIDIADTFFFKAKWGTSFASLSDFLPILTQVFASISDVPDPDDIYVVFLSDDVETSPLCSDSCGYHYYFNDTNNNAIKFMFIGSTGDLNNCDGCDAPNGPWSTLTNQLVNSFVHELIATVSNPVPWTGWYDANGLENSQKCAGQYIDSAPFRPDPSTSWNVVVGAGVEPHWFLIQGNWDICSNTCQVVGTVNCDLHAPKKPITSNPHAPSNAHSIQFNMLSLFIIGLIAFLF